MKVIFMGTPEFARRPLEYLHHSARHQILAVVTGPDQASGRGLKVFPTPVKLSAQALGLQVLTPVSLKDEKLGDELRGIGADLFMVVAFKILPRSLYSIPPFGSINLHGSLLPKYRGAAPINWALINGEKETGLTAFFLEQKVDTGQIIYQEKIDIGQEETFDELYLRMSEMAGPVLVKTLDLIESGRATPIPQDSTQVSPAPKLTPEDALIDWGFPARNVVNFVRGMSSVPGAYTIFKGKRIKILKAREEVISGPAGIRPGTILADKKRFLAAVADGAVELTSVQPEGKGRITGEEFLRGYRPQGGEILGERNIQG